MVGISTVSTLLLPGNTKEGHHPHIESRQTELKLLFIILMRYYVFHLGSKLLPKTFSLPSGPSLHFLTSIHPPIHSLPSNLYLLSCTLYPSTQNLFLYSSSTLHSLTPIPILNLSTFHPCIHPLPIHQITHSSIFLLSVKQHFRNNKTSQILIYCKSILIGRMI